MNHKPHRVFPNAYLKLQFEKADPSLPAISGHIEIWLKDSHFRYKDQTKRYPSEILADLKHPQGLGDPPVTMEEIMDMQSRYDNQSGPDFVEFGGNTANGDGFLFEAGASGPHAKEAGELLGLVEQVMCEAPKAGWVETGKETVAGEKCTVYAGKFKGSLNGASFESIVTRHCNSPFIFKYEVRDSKFPEHRLSWEVIEFKADAVQESDFPHL